jgi:phenylpyruvate tautomerase PptA (4-oxalocrotonate tautomerase family)
MAQIKIYGEGRHLREVRDRLSDILHGAFQECLGLPADKRFQRFIALDAADFLHPPDRSAAYTIIEISMFEGRSAETKRALLHALMGNIAEGLGIAAQDIEITIFETPRANWGIRGQTGDVLDLDYKVES